MDCTECGENGATKVAVEYTNGRTERIHLCPDCRTEFKQGEFVQSVDERGE